MTDDERLKILTGEFFTKTESFFNSLVMGANELHHMLREIRALAHGRLLERDDEDIDNGCG